MDPLNITITDLTLGTVVGEHYDTDKEYRVPLTLADAIVEAAARLLMLDSDWVSVKTQVRNIRDEEIRAHVAVEIEAALTGTFEATNSYGEKTGKKTTLREQIARQVEEAIRIDNRNSYSRQPTPFEKVIREEVDKALHAELAEIVKDEKAKVVAAVRAKAADLIATAVREGVGR